VSETVQVELKSGRVYAPAWRCGSTMPLAFWNASTLFMSSRRSDPTYRGLHSFTFRKHVVWDTLGA